MKRWQFLIVLCLSVLSLFDEKPKLAEAEETAIDYGYCMNDDLILEDIPVADFSSFAYPLRKMVCPKDKKNCSEHEKIPEEIFRVTQKYMNSEQEKWCSGENCYWGHDGIDVHKRGAQPGEYDVIATQSGKVIVAKKGTVGVGWGNRIVLATRISRYSEQILTFQYAHMHEGTLMYGACKNVSKGDAIGKEGKSGFGTDTHLHLTVRL